MPLVQQINALEPQTKALSDEQLRARTEEFKQRIGERMQPFFLEAKSVIVDEQGPVDEIDEGRIKQLETERDAALRDVLQEILPEAFAVVREAGRRVLNMRHFDVQL